jgi:hypothetical protein
MEKETQTPATTAEPLHNPPVEEQAADAQPEAEPAAKTTEQKPTETPPAIAPAAPHPAPAILPIVLIVTGLLLMAAMGYLFLTKTA